MFLERFFNSQIGLTITATSRQSEPGSNVHEIVFEQGEYKSGWETVGDI